MILLRHGQSLFNRHFSETGRDPGIADPPLTDHGHAQAERAARDLADAGIGRIIASPYTRALQTAAPIARLLGLQVRVETLVRERAAFSCDIGTHRDTLRLAWPALALDHIDAVWWPTGQEADAQVAVRAAQFLAHIAALPVSAHAPETLVVSHWGFLLALTGRSLENGQWIRWRPGAG